MHAFPCGTTALDFVGTLRARADDAPTEKLDSIESLDAWFVESGLIDDVPGATPDDLVAAREVREAIYEVITARRQGEVLPHGAVETLNGRAAEAPVSVRLDGRVRRAGSVGNALSSLARETIEIVGGEDAELLRECARPGCTQVYLDRSRGRRREWCAMKTCGNRVKASKFRARHRVDAD